MEKVLRIFQTPRILNLWVCELCKLGSAMLDLMQIGFCMTMIWQVFLCNVQFVDVGTMVSPTVYARRSLCYLMSDMPQEALNDAVQAQVISPIWHIASYLQAVALSALGRENDSEVALKEGSVLEEKKNKTAWLKKTEGQNQNIFSSKWRWPLVVNWSCVVSWSQWTKALQPQSNHNIKMDRKMVPIFLYLWPVGLLSFWSILSKHYWVGGFGQFYPGMLPLFIYV